MEHFFVHERLKISEAYSEPSLKPKMQLFAKIINEAHQLFLQKNPS